MKNVRRSETERPNERSRLDAGAHVVAGDHERRVRSPQSRKRLREDVEPLTRRQLAQKQHQRSGWEREAAGGSGPASRAT